MENKSVWVVTAGQYSDYTIVAIYDNKEAAEKYVELHRKYDRWCEFNDVREWKLNSTVPLIRPIYHVEINLDGEIIEQYTESTEFNKPVEKIIDWDDTIVGESDRSFDVALKIARDKLGMIKAERERLNLI